MKIAISQPTYLPWLGYFDLIDQVDRFVVLDSVQFEKQSWQQRNRIKTPTGLQWLTVPVVFRGRLAQKIQEVEIRESGFSGSHLRAIELNYRRAPFFEKYFGDLKAILADEASPRLADLNFRIIQWLMNCLEIRTPLVKSSEVHCEGKRSQLLVNLCAALGADSYLSPIGSAAYLLAELHLFEQGHIEVSFQHYEHPRYRQQFGEFMPYASVLDLLFNEGERAGEIVRSGRRAPFPPAEVAMMAASMEKA